MKKSLVAFVSAVALALVMFAPSKASAQYGWGWGGGGVNIYVGPRYPYYGYGYAYPRYGYGYAYPYYAMDTHIRVTVMADTTHTGVVTRGVTGGGGISRAVVILNEGGERMARRPTARATDKTRASGVRRRW